MGKKANQEFSFEPLRQAVPYVLAGALTIAVATVGSFSKHNQEVNLNLDTIAQTEYGVSVDQLSELYVVADLSDALGLASAADVATNYVVASTMYSSGQAATTGKLEKPTITDVQASRGVIEYTVQEGDTMQSIAANYGITMDQIRWSNGMKNTDVSPGMVLYLPSSDGIAYLVKADDTLESIAERYGSSVEELVAANDLELSGISEGMRIMVKGGSLPETERPEYVAPVVAQPSYSYTYLGSTAVRTNMTVIYTGLSLSTPYTPGQCTSWAWYKRPDLPAFMGNASNWASAAAAAGFPVNRVPEAGAVFQTYEGWYGHVGYVEAVNPDGSIVITEMNYGGVAYQVIRSVVPASQTGAFNYIHRK